MFKVLIIGNPNVGKSTLFNSLTKSNEHTGNFHGVTVEEKRKIITYKNAKIEFIDTPGLYSMNCFSFEEEVSKNIILNTDGTRLLLVDANSLRRNLYLAVQMKELNLRFKLLINNYDYFVKHGNRIDLNKFNFGMETKIINAKKIKLTPELINLEKEEQTNTNDKKFFETDKNAAKSEKNLTNFNDFNAKNKIFTNFEEANINYLQPFINAVKSKFNLTEDKIIKAFNGIYTSLKDEEIEFIKSLNPQIVKARYDYIDSVLNCAIKTKNNYVYGASKLDKFLLKPIVMLPLFLLFFFASVYLIFFLLGPAISSVLNLLIEHLLFTPIINLIYLITSNVWVIEFINNGVFSSITTVLTFLPQVCLLFVFLTLLEDSGLISRLSFIMDDFLSLFGLNGKSVYIILMGLGCNTMSTTASRNADNKNLKIKTALINPYISCMARLPVYVIVASAFFGAKAYFVVVGLYLLGLAVALVMALILNKTILKNKTNNLLLEFPALRGVDFAHIYKVAKQNAIDFTRRVFGVVLSVGIIVWVLTHTTFGFAYTDIVTESIMFLIADKLAFIFAPIGLNSAGVVTALIVGIMAKELIVSTMSITNNVVGTSALIFSLTSLTSVVHFNVASAVSFLVFTLLYCPCISNLAVLKREVGSFYMWFAIISQLTTAYLISFIFYQGITNGIIYPILTIILAAIILAATIYIIKKVKHPKCLTCNKCRK